MAWNYAEKLKDPRWQKRRLEVFERDDWTCQECGATDRTLHIHHKFYRRGLEPWQYSDAALDTLCEDCHRLKESGRRIERNKLLSQNKEDEIRAETYRPINTSESSNVWHQEQCEFILGGRRCIRGKNHQAGIHRFNI